MTAKDNHDKMHDTTHQKVLDFSWNGAEQPGVAEELRGLTQHIHPSVPNPAPLGLFAFGLTTALLQVCHTQLGGTTDEDLNGTKNLVWGFAIFYGGLLQLIAGLHEVKRNNILGYTAFLSYGGWWMSIGLANIVLMMTPNEAAVTVGFNPKAMKAMLSLWGCLTFVFWICAFSANKTLCVLFFSLMMTFFLLAAGVSNAWVDRLGGWVGMATSLIAFELGSAELINETFGAGKTEVIPLGTWNFDILDSIGRFRNRARRTQNHGNEPHESNVEIPELQS